MEIVWDIQVSSFPISKHDKSFAFFHVRYEKLDRSIERQWLHLSRVTDLHRGWRIIRFGKSIDEKEGKMISRRWWKTRRHYFAAIERYFFWFLMASNSNAEVIGCFSCSCFSINRTMILQLISDKTNFKGPLKYFVITEIRYILNQQLKVYKVSLYWKNFLPLSTNF